MASSLLPNHLRANRKRMALSQSDVAFLLGTDRSESISRYEHFDRIPGLETALACEVIFKRPLRELFPGLYQKIENKVATRAKQLLQRVEGLKGSRRTDRKRQVLSDTGDAKTDNMQEPT